tara:strand:- start:119 stop:328 length:210 start_codon:yes stop_codon:yes gene_type:complete
LGIFNKLKKILWTNICTKDLTGIACSLNKWWKTRYPEYKIIVSPNKEFEQVLIQEMQEWQIIKVNNPSL